MNIKNLIESGKSNKEIARPFNSNIRNKISESYESGIKSYLSRIGLSKIKIPSDFPEDGKWTPNVNITIMPEDVGPISPIFTKIELKYSFGQNPEGGDIVLNLIYDYAHPGGGSNGKSVALTFNELGKYKSTEPGYAVR